MSIVPVCRSLLPAPGMKAFLLVAAAVASLAQAKTCSHVFCRVRKFNGKSHVIVMHDRKEKHGIHHICKVGLKYKDRCDCECGTLGVDIHSHMGHAPCTVWDSFKKCDVHRGSQDISNNVIPTGGVLKIQAEYGFLSHMARKDIEGSPRKRLNGEIEKSMDHMYITPKGSGGAAFAEWQIVTRKTGVYEFSLHFRNPGTTEQWQLKSHPGNWEIGNDKNIRTVNVAFRHANDWTFIDAKIELQEGENTISLHTGQGGQAEIDFMRVADYGTNWLKIF